MRILLMILFFIGQGLTGLAVDGRSPKSNNINKTACTIECSINQSDDKTSVDQLSDGGLLLTRLFTNS